MVLLFMGQFPACLSEYFDAMGQMANAQAP